ncbi:MAG: GNAT family N-acetyltransferase [Defluviitaleaceae bacterium]|nr:GNAT family N-acetyltransferase [Defluviitaleaceae bacterium]
MEAELLSMENINLLVQMEQRARFSEPDIFVEGFDADVFRSDTEDALQNPLFATARCIMCIDEDGHAIGRIDFAIVPSFSFGGNTQVYVDWVYVLKDNRHKGVAQFLFSQMSAFIKASGVKEYFLLMADNDEAQSFYRSIESGEMQNYDVLRKYL